MPGTRLIHIMVWSEREGVVIKTCLCVLDHLLERSRLVVVLVIWRCSCEARPLPVLFFFLFLLWMKGHVQVGQTGYQALLSLLPSGCFVVWCFFSAPWAIASCNLFWRKPACAAVQEMGECRRMEQRCQRLYNRQLSPSLVLFSHLKRTVFASPG